MSWKKIERGLLCLNNFQQGGVPTFLHDEDFLDWVTLRNLAEGHLE